MKISEDVLQKMYINKNMTVAEVAKELKISYSVTLYHMRKYNIARRSISDALKGKPKSIAHRKKLSEAQKGNKNPNFGKGRKCGHRCWYSCPDGKVVSMRSHWEVWYAEYLRENNIYFKYECLTFILKDGRAYTPDFFLPNTNEFVEVKGWLTPEHKDRIECFRNDYPNNKLIIANKDYLNNLGIDLRRNWIKSKPKFKCNFCATEYHRCYPQQIYCSITCRNKANNAGIKTNSSSPKIKRKYNGIQSGENNNSVKLNTAIVGLILKLKAENKKIKDIVKITGSSYGNIYNITHGLSWKHLSVSLK